MDTVDNLLAEPIFKIGDLQTTLGTLLAAAVVVIATLLIASLAKSAVKRYIKRVSKDELGAAGSYGTVIQIIIWFIGFELALHLLGIHLTAFFAAGGVFALGAGFAVKNIVENFLSGGILRLEKTIRPGDLIIVNNKWVYVQRMGIRTITALTYDGEEVLIPNTLVAQSMVENLTRRDRLHRLQVKVGVSYDSNLDLVRDTLEKTIDKLEWRSKAKEPIIYLDEFGDSSINYSVEVWIDDANDSRGRKSDLHEVVWRALKDAGITIAYPQLDLHLDQDVVNGISNR